MINELILWLNKIFHVHRWVFYDYIPYTDKNTPWGAGYRICEKCGEKQTHWKVKK